MLSFCDNFRHFASHCLCFYTFSVELVEIFTSFISKRYKKGLKIKRVKFEALICIGKSIDFVLFRFVSFDDTPRFSWFFLSKICRVWPATALLYHKVCLGSIFRQVVIKDKENDHYDHEVHCLDNSSNLLL